MNIDSYDVKKCNYSFIAHGFFRFFIVKNRILKLNINLQSQFLLNAFCILMTRI